MTISIGPASTAISGSAVTTLSIGHTISGMVPLLLVRVALRGSGSTPSGVTAKWGGSGGTAMTLVQSNSASGRQWTGIFVLADPAALGASTVYLAWSNSAVAKAWAQDVTGSDGTASGGVGTNVNAGSISVDVSSAVDDLVVDVICAGSGRTLTAGAGQTAEGNETVGDAVCDASVEVGAASVTMSWSLGSSGNVCLSACSLAHSVAAAGSSGNWLAFF